MELQPWQQKNHSGYRLSILTSCWKKWIKIPKKNQKTESDGKELRKIEEREAEETDFLDVASFCHGNAERKSLTLLEKVKNGGRRG